MSRAPSGFSLLSRLTIDGEVSRDLLEAIRSRRVSSEGVANAINFWLAKQPDRQAAALALAARFTALGVEFETPSRLTDWLAADHPDSSPPAFLVHRDPDGAGEVLDPRAAPADGIWQARYQYEDYPDWIRDRRRRPGPEAEETPANRRARWQNDLIEQSLKEDAALSESLENERKKKKGGRFSNLDLD